ncbi:TolC family protein [Mucilaginibacter myungsuensis]|uniref:TolC family protein n=1 Tax=Mucilaginibacter myungsuensis TaxID=649104 RepID=A0A929PVJ1_9SPHI|nr:TolC family protein [Mucilaginibacter myungsuensis]MBE9661189.1 TolC family protein [Mucilaginibacter myungsuensis]MDN3597334.1 TolC family protein [Mucilaginibacter myungsuensis]
MKHIKIVCLLALLAVSQMGLAQNAPRLTLKEAVEIALKNNYNIRLAQNNNTIAKNNVTIGNAGMLPQVTGDLTTNASRQTVQQTRSDGTVNNLNGIRNSNNSYGPSLNWTIFDGLAMFANYDLLKQQNQLSDLRLRDTIQSTMADVIATYYNLINQNAQLRAQKGVIEISRTQVRIANDKFTVGRAAKLELLNAQVNLNTDTAALITLEQQYRSTKIRLNQLLIRDLQSDFSVADTIIVDDKLKLADVINNAQTQNPAILSAEINKRVADISLKQIRSTRYPVLSVGTGYTWTNSATPAGFTRTQNAHGFNYGLTASVNIFDGFNQWRRERNAKIQIDNAGISAKQVRLDVEAQISDLFMSYLAGLQLIKIGDANVALAKRNLEITLDKYKLGNITPLEVREAQRNYLTATSTFFSAEYQSKLAEITLKQITNSINIE